MTAERPPEGYMGKGFWYAVLTALIWGCAPAVEKAGLSGRLDPFSGVVIRTLGIAVICALGFVFSGRLSTIHTIDTRSALFVIAGGILAGLIGQFAFYSALKAGEASVVVPVAATYPLFALIISILFLGESITAQKLLGAGMIVGGVVLLR